jgi:hypothetical protein
MGVSHDRILEVFDGAMSFLAVNMTLHIRRIGPFISPVRTKRWAFSRGDAPEGGHVA